MLTVGSSYTRREIHQALGGGVQEFLPHVNGEVVCGAFRKDSNPDAPNVVLPGHGPEVRRWSRVFAAQRHHVPVFVKATTNVWRYVGDYRVAKVEEDAAAIARHAPIKTRHEVSMVLHLERRES